MWDARDNPVVTPYASIEKVAIEPQAGDLSGVRAVLLEAKLLWGSDAINVRHLRSRRALRLGDLGFDVPAAPDLVIAREDEEGRLALCLPNGAAVPEGCRMSLRMGRATLRLSLVADDVDAPSRPVPDSRVALGIIAAAALHLVILGLVAHGRAPDGAQDEAAIETMQRMVASAEERAVAELAAAKERSEQEALTVPSSNHASPKPAAVAGTQVKERGAAGNPGRTKLAQARITRGEDPRAARPGHEEVATFGILALLAGPEGGNGAGSSAFATDTGPAAMGNIFGQTIHDAEGAGSLGLSGPGEGAGGLGAGVPLSFIGTIGKANGDGSGQGFGCCGGRLPPQSRHVAWGLSMSSGVLTVHGRLPPEAIQRVIRQSFGRLRACYERGLQRSPDLEGRIAVKFVIDREGDVAMASTSESTLGDASVESCVAKAYEAMSFPKPEGGIVTVVYPIVFTRTSP